MAPWILIILSLWCPKLTIMYGTGIEDLKMALIRETGPPFTDITWWSRNISKPRSLFQSHASSSREVLTFLRVCTWYSLRASFFFVYMFKKGKAFLHWKRFTFRLPLLHILQLRNTGCRGEKLHQFWANNHIQYLPGWNRRASWWKRHNCPLALYFLVLHSQQHQCNVAFVHPTIHPVPNN